ncbi:aminoglycoside phosphotransferase family protein [Thioclava sp.]|uniref:aminoglycoside phosphotransferase family protein n=1 Tax=Thioclava sp. TaxID=1933450 RepID=UPI003AA834AC
MVDSRAVDRFLTRANWADATRVKLAGDASARSYDRLSLNGQTAVLMKAPPGEEMSRFLRIGDYLAQAGFSTPKVLARAEPDGFLLLEDFGDTLAARALADDPRREAEIYGQITDLLIALQDVPAPDFLPLLDGPALAELLALTPDWYPCLSPEAAAALTKKIADLYTELAQEPSGICLRDFHAENIILLDRAGVRGLGLLDFQDAVRCHPAYDLVSALQDARRDVSQACARREIAHFAARSGIEADRFAAIYALLGTQRALRILGIFARLCLRDGKPGYLALMRRVWRNIERNLRHPALNGIAQDLRAAYSEPTAELIAELEAACATRRNP